MLLIDLVMTTTKMFSSCEISQDKGRRIVKSVIQ